MLDESERRFSAPIENEGAQERKDRNQSDLRNLRLTVWLMDGLLYTDTCSCVGRMPDR